MSMRTYLLCILFLMTSVLCFAQAPDLFISEYVEGTSNQKAIEIFNATIGTVDLSQYSLKRQLNGSGDFDDELMLSGNLPYYNPYVIVMSSTTGMTLEGQPYVDLATNSPVMNFNGNDCIALCKNGVPIDMVGVTNQISPWGQDITLIRNAEVYMPVPVWQPQEWQTFPVNTFSDLGTYAGVFDWDPVIVLLSPNGGELWHIGSSHTITWAHSHCAETVNIKLFNGIETIVLTDSTENDNEWIWNIPVTLPTSTNYTIKVTSNHDYSPYSPPNDASNSTFAIVAANANDDQFAHSSIPVLYSNIPNPFSSSTTIRFDAKLNQSVTLEVYNIRGQKVATLLNNERPNDAQSYSWNRTDNKGNRLPSGVYLYKMQSGSYSSTKKMILLK